MDFPLHRVIIRSDQKRDIICEYKQIDPGMSQRNPVRKVLYIVSEKSNYISVYVNCTCILP